jgi:hypothetical protein
MTPVPIQPTRGFALPDMRYSRRHLRPGVKAAMGGIDTAGAGGAGAGAHRGSQTRAKPPKYAEHWQSGLAGNLLFGRM